MNPALVIIVVIACLVAIGVGAYFLLKKKKPDSDSAVAEVPLIEDPLPALIEAPLPALPAMVSVQGWPVVSPSDPIAPVSPEPMAATTWVDDLTTMPAEIPVEASTAELDLARADPTAGLFPSTADLKAQDQGAQQVAPVDAPAPAPVLAPVFAPAPAQAETKAKACGGTRIWDGKVCRERSVKPVAAAAKLDVSPATIPPAKPKSKGCGPGEIWDGNECRPPRPKNPSPTTPNAPPGQPVAEGSQAWNDNAAYRAARKHEQQGPAPPPPPGSGGCPPGKSRDPKTKNCRPTAGLEASQKRVADAATGRAVQRQSRFIGQGRPSSEVDAEVARRGGHWFD